MAQLQPEVEAIARIRVVGVGGSGKGAVNHMIGEKVRGVEFIAINNDEQVLDELRKEVDALIVIPNDRLLATVAKDTTLKNAFAMCDDVLKQAVEGISELITNPGIINVDFADIRA